MVNPIYKASAFIVLCVVLSLTVVVCKVWVIVSFVLYLVKDTPFNWLVFWVGIVALVLLFVSYAASLIFSKQFKEQKELAAVTSPPGPAKSKFRQRLEEAQEAQRKRREADNG